jgi:hypothetical protein
MNALALQAGNPIGYEVRETTLQLFIRKRNYLKLNK